ncbi:hypothetical protein ACFO5Q_02060 [Kordiimonas lipolytica]|uniref:Tetratricopeptide repeat protein n=1 Tax=Kordiimonas lipolytica TaxID=1662421 RepID=A0ABV8U608_9PROT|nr:hypothetical protein [Kordiimonas lipolytica]
MRVLVFTLCLLFLGPPSAHADVNAGWEAYRAGDYQKARDLFEAAGGAEGYAAACRTGLVLGGFFENGETQVHTLHRALDDCNAAIELDGDQLDARISYAVGLGFEGKRLKKVKYAKASRRKLEDLIVVSGDYGILHAALGGWHTTVYEAGFFARLALGAKRGIARQQFEKAVTLAPNDIGVRFEFIKYLAYGKKDEHKEALEEIKQVSALPAHDAFDRFLVAQARTIGAMIVAGSEDGLEAALEAATPFASIRDHKNLPAYPLETD